MTENEMLEFEIAKKKVEKARQKVLQREKDVAEKERDIRNKEIDLDNKQRTITSDISRLNELREKVLNCELPEMRDRMRLAYIYNDLCYVSLTSKYSDTEYIKGLASILSGHNTDVIKSEEEECEITN